MIRACVLSSAFRVRPGLPTKERLVSSMAIPWKGVRMKEKGSMRDALEMVDLPAKDPGDNQVLIKMMAAPINPSDLNTVQGKYPLTPKYDDVPGHEGVGQVVSTGAGTSTLKPGDMVVPLTSGLGTWRTHGVYDEKDWHKIPDNLRIEDAATLTINPATALSMLTKFETLQPGDVVVQNGANSAVGKHVIQLCKHMGVRSVNVVRDRSGAEKRQLKEALKELGADMIVTPDNVRQKIKEAGMPAPKLALNCVGGESATTLSKMLMPQGTIVTYGGMSMQPVTIPTPVLIFKDIKVRGFWISGGETSADPQAKKLLLDDVVSLIQQGVLKAEYKRIRFDECMEALEAAEAGAKEKFIITM